MWKASLNVSCYNVVVWSYRQVEREFNNRSRTPEHLLTCGSKRGKFFVTYVLKVDNSKTGGSAGDERFEVINEQQLLLLLDELFNDKLPFLHFFGIPIRR